MNKKEYDVIYALKSMREISGYNFGYEYQDVGVVVSKCYELERDAHGSNVVFVCDALSRGILPGHPFFGDLWDFVPYHRRYYDYETAKEAAIKINEQLKNNYKPMNKEWAHKVRNFFDKKILSRGLMSAEELQAEYLEYEKKYLDLANEKGIFTEEEKENKKVKIKK